MKKLFGWLWWQEAEGAMATKTKTARQLGIKIWEESICYSISKKSWPVLYTVCPGSSDPPEKILNIFASENEVYTIF